MKTTRLITPWTLIALAPSLAACGSQTPDTGPTAGSKLAIAVAPLSLPRLDDACYELYVFNAADPDAGQLVWSQDGLCADRYGDGAGALAFVGSCDASGAGGERPASVRLVLTDLCTGGSCVLPAPGPTSIPTADFDNPCPAPEGCVVETTCRANADTQVKFDLVVIRAANQGFFDVAVDFEDIFCSAKFDCENETGGAIKLLHNPATNQRDTTAVMGFACTTGKDQETWLYMNDVKVTCYDTSNSIVSETYIDPLGGPGNMGARGPLFFQTAAYLGNEAFVPYEKCYWNLAFGVRESALTNRCVLTVRATAADEELPGDHTRVGKIYPVIDWTIDLNSIPGKLDCGKHAVNELGSGVTTEYTTTAGEGFRRFIPCDNPTNGGGSPGRTLCEGHVDGVTGLTAFTQEGRFMSATVAGVDSIEYPLPADRNLGGCCFDVCCTDGP